MAGKAEKFVSLESLTLGDIETDSTSSSHGYDVYSTDDYLSTLQSPKHGDFSNEKGIKALPRRRTKSQRSLVVQLAKALYPELSEIAAIINYERLIVPEKGFVSQKEKERKAVEMSPKNNSGGKLLKIQGPWAGQDIDPVDLNEPAAIPMPVTIGKSSDFDLVFELLAQNTTIDEGDETGTLGLETTWNNPILEFKRGIVYEDGRFDLCKKVVGPTHIGN